MSCLHKISLVFLGEMLLALLLAVAAAKPYPTAFEPAEWSDHNIVLVDDKWVHAHRPLPTDPQPYPPYDDKALQNDTSIVFLIAALRETRCPDTLHWLFSHAAHPKRVFAGVVQQNRPDDKDCLAGMCELFAKPLAKNPTTGEYENRPAPDNCPFFEHVRMHRMLASQAKGPVYARALQAELVQPTDDFCMQIDAHTHAVQDWDVLMLREWNNARNEYAVLSTYPNNVHEMGINANSHWEMPHLCKADFSEGRGKVHNKQASGCANLDRPLLSPLWAAGLSFNRCHAERNVPNDINLKSIFTGEEFGRGIRLWTHGYDFYSITRPYIGVYYGDEKAGGGTEWDFSESDAAKSSERLATLLKWPDSNQSDAAIAELGTYNAGKRRTIEQYYEFSGVDPIHQTIEDHCVVAWVPWLTDAEASAYSEYPQVTPAVLREPVAGNFTIHLTPRRLNVRAVSAALGPHAPLIAAFGVSVIVGLVVYFWRNHNRYAKFRVTKFNV